MDQNHPTAFISYSWDNPEHEVWVHKFVNNLRKNGGIDATFDKFELQDGTVNLFSMMTSGFRDKDFVIIILTEEYAKKADNEQGGVGFETMLTYPLLQTNRDKLIFVMRHQGEFDRVFPFHLKGYYAIDFSDDMKFEEKFNELLHRLHRIDSYEKEPVGEIPELKLRKSQGSFLAHSQPSIADIKIPNLKTELVNKEDSNLYHKKYSDKVIYISISIAGLLLTFLTAIQYLASEFDFFNKYRRIISIVDLLLLFLICTYLVRIWYVSKKQAFFENKKKIIFGVIIAIFLFTFFYFDTIFTSQSETTIKLLSEPAPKSDEIEDEKFTPPEEIKKELTEKRKEDFNPTINELISDDIFIVKKFKKHNKMYSPDIKKLLIDDIEADISKQIDTQNDIDYNVFNRDKAYTDVINKANECEEFIKKHGYDADKYSDMIAFREQAYAKGKTRALAILLARDYYRLGRFYVNQNIKQEGFIKFTKAMEYYFDVLKLTKKDVAYRNTLNDILYSIGQIFHSIGDIKHINIQWREDAYLMSSAYLEISSSLNEKKLYPKYYSGMVNHKLSIISNNDSKRVYLLDSEKYYTQSLLQNI